MAATASRSPRTRRRSAVEFLKYLVNLDDQKAFAATGAGIPVVKGAEAGLTDANLQAISKATQSAPAVKLWLDTLLRQLRPARR